MTHKLIIALAILFSCSLYRNCTAWISLDLVLDCGMDLSTKGLKFGGKMRSTFNMTQIFALMFSFLLSLDLYAWGEIGHQVTAEIAEQILAKDEKTLTAIRAIIGVEPLAIASIWPDRVKSDPRFDAFSKYHYITIFRDPKKVADRSAMTVLKKYPLILSDNKSTREAKMMALRYLIHVAGDIHQPLHVGNEFDTGGNSCQVDFQLSTEGEVKRLNLHEVWDTNLVEYVTDKYKREAKSKNKYFGYKEMAPLLMAKYKDLIAGASKDVDIEGWVNESRILRETQVYPDQIADHARPYCRGSSDKSKPQDIPVLGAGYIEVKSLLIEERLVLAGIHMASLLKKTFSGSSLTKPTEAEIIKELML